MTRFEKILKGYIAQQEQMKAEEEAKQKGFRQVRFSPYKLRSTQQIVFSLN